MRALTEFLLPELVALLDAPGKHHAITMDSNTEEMGEESESQSALSQVLPKTQHRVMMVRYTNTAEQTITVVDRSFAIDAFIPQQVIAELRTSYRYQSLSRLRGSVIRIDKYHFATPERCYASDQLPLPQRSVSMALSSKNRARIYLWVDNLTIIDDNELAVNPLPAVEEQPQVDAVLQTLGLPELETRLMIKQGLPPLDNLPGTTAEQFDGEHPLLEEDLCEIPEEQEEELNAQEGWTPQILQPSDSQLIEENGSVPMTESQDMDIAVASERLQHRQPPQVTAISQDVDESVPDSQDDHFQRENIRKNFLQCSDTESDDDIKDRSQRQQRMQRNNNRRSTSSPRSQTQGEGDLSAEAASTEEHDRNIGTEGTLEGIKLSLTANDEEFLTQAQSVGGSQQQSNEQSEVEMQISDEIAPRVDAAAKESKSFLGSVSKLGRLLGDVLRPDLPKENRVQPCTQLPDDISHDAPCELSTSNIAIHATISQIIDAEASTRATHGPLRTVGGGKDIVPNFTEQIDEIENTESGTEQSQWVDMDGMDNWHTQPNDESQRFESDHFNDVHAEEREQKGIQLREMKKTVVSVGTSSMMSQNEIESIARIRVTSRGPARIDDAAVVNPSERISHTMTSQRDVGIKPIDTVIATESTQASLRSVGDMHPSSAITKIDVSKQPRNKKRALRSVKPQDQISPTPPVTKASPSTNSKIVSNNRGKMLSKSGFSQQLFAKPLLMESRPKKQRRQEPAAAKLDISVQHQRETRILFPFGSPTFTVGSSSQIHPTPDPARVSTGICSLKKYSAASSQHRASKRYEHLFPPLRMDDLKQLIAQKKN